MAERKTKGCYRSFIAPSRSTGRQGRGLVDEPPGAATWLRHSSACPELPDAAVTERQMAA